MRYLTIGVIIVTTFIVSLFLIASCAVLLARATPPEVITIPDAKWLPGAHSMPDEEICLFDRYPILYCESLDKSLVISYNIDLHEISSTRQRVRNISIEKLIVAFGKPQGIQTFSNVVDVWWAKCYVVIYTTKFSPTDKPEYIVWGDAPIPSYVGAWKGFQSNVQ